MLIILFPYKFIKYFFKKYQVSDLKKKFKGKIEIHDMSNIVSKNYHKAFKGKRYKKALVFNNIPEWESHLIKKIQREKKIFVVNLISFESFKSLNIYYLLSKYKINIIEMNSAEVYEFMASNTMYLKVCTFFKYLLFNRARLMLVLKSIFIGKLINFFKFKSIYVTVCGSTAKRLLLPKIKNAEKTQFVNFHSSDFSNYLLNQKKNNFKNKKNYIVFLDTKTPAFTGDKLYLQYKINYNTKKWYEDLNNFLEKIEKTFNSKVIIVPHPTVREVKNIYYKKKFKVSKDLDATNKLIPNCKFVISIGATTAVSYCVLYNKPLTFTCNDQMIKYNPIMFSEMKKLSKILSSKIININERFIKDRINLNVNKKKYLNYKFKYLTSKKINKINNSEILKKLVFHN